MSVELRGVGEGMRDWEETETMRGIEVDDHSKSSASGLR